VTCCSGLLDVCRSGLTVRAWNTLADSTAESDSSRCRGYTPSLQVPLLSFSVYRIVRSKLLRLEPLCLQKAGSYAEPAASFVISSTVADHDVIPRWNQTGCLMLPPQWLIITSSHDGNRPLDAAGKLHGASTSSPGKRPLRSTSPTLEATAMPHSHLPVTSAVLATRSCRGHVARQSLHKNR
jgi:hypothetical protein